MKIGIIYFNPVNFINFTPTYKHVIVHTFTLHMIHEYVIIE